MRKTLRGARLFIVVLSAWAIWEARGVVTPAPNRAFGTNAAGANVIAQMQAESRNPILSNVVIHFFNLSPVNATGDTNVDFEQWSGTLISPEWAVTCAHALQGTNLRGGGLVVGDILYNYGGSSFADPVAAAIAEFRIHPSWTKDGYTNGYDIALVRLSVPVTNVAAFPHLPATLFPGSMGVVFAGYGRPGNGDVGESTNIVGNFAVGINSLDGVGGQSLTDGYGHANTRYSNWVSSVAFMDFDQWELTQFYCTDPMNVPYTNSFPAAVTSLSTMGENEINRAVQACPSPIQAAHGYIAATICDFLPAAGDSGGPAFQWNSAPTIPAPGTFFVPTTPTIMGVMSYRALGANTTNATSVYGNVVGFTLVQPHVGWIHQETGLGDAGPVTFVKKPIDVSLVNTRILSEQASGADQTEVTFTTDLQNADTGVYRDLSVYMVNTNLPLSASIVDNQLSFDHLAELGSASGSADTLVVRVANGDLSAVRNAILSGAALEISGFEEQVYSGPQKYIDQPTDDAFEGTTFNAFGELVLIFRTPTGLINELQSGDILMADPTPGAYRPMQPAPTDALPPPYLGQQVPFEVSSVSVVSGKTHVAGHKRDIWEILKSGTFIASDENFNGSHRDLFDPPVENTYTGSEKTNRTTQGKLIESQDPNSSALADLLGMNAVPWHFNDVEITRYLHLSGQVLLRSSGLRTQLSFRNFALKKVSVGIDAGVVASLVLETTGSNNNISVPILDKQKELARIPLGAVPFTVAGVPCSVGLGFVLSVGAEANAPGGLSIPLETAINVGAEIGWTNGQSFSTPITQFVAPHVSDPTVFDAVSLNAKAWAEARLDVNLSVAGGLASAGPSLAIRAEAGFAVEPFNDPWWTIDAGADLVGGFELNFLGLTVAHVEATNHIATFYHNDAGGPLLPLPKSTAAKNAVIPPIDLSPKAGRDTRWGLAFAVSNSFSAAYSKGFIVPLNGGGYGVGGASALVSFLGTITADGKPQWLQTFPNGAKPVAGRQLADGALMIAGYAGFDWWLARYQTNGTRDWVASQRFQGGDFRDFAVRFATNGDPEYYLAGFYTPVVVTQSDPVVMKLDKNGNVLWVKVYTFPGDDEVYQIRLLSDGNFALCGTTASPVGTDVLIGARGNGLVMKIDPNGNLLWGTAVAGRWGMAFQDVVEAPDGSLFAVGAHGDIVRDYYPSIMVAKFTASGELVNHVLIGDDPDWIDELPDGGDTPYDTATHAEWTSNGVVVVGRTGLGVSESAFVMCVTDELGVRWFSAFDGPKACAFEDVTVTDSGIAALGWAESVWPIPFGTRSPAWLLSLPWEGMMRFHPETGVQSKYLQPHVYLSSSAPDFLGIFTDASGNVYRQATAPVSFGISNLTVTAGAAVIAGVNTPFETRRLERIELSTIDSYGAFAAYNQLTGTNGLATGDIDGDGISNGSEFFFGTDPLVRTTNGPPQLAIRYDATGGNVSIDFSRARSALTQPFNLQFTTNFLGWQTLSNAVLTSRGSDDSFDLLRLTLPQPDPDHAFFRLELPCE